MGRKVNPSFFTFNSQLKKSNLAERVKGVNFYLVKDGYKNQKDDYFSGFQYNNYNNPFNGVVQSNFSQRQRVM